MTKKYTTTITAVSVNEHATVVRYLDEDYKFETFDVYLTGKLVLEGLHNFEGAGIGDALYEADRASRPEPKPEEAQEAD